MREFAFVAAIRNLIATGRERIGAANFVKIAQRPGSETSLSPCGNRPAPRNILKQIEIINFLKHCLPVLNLLDYLGNNLKDASHGDL